MTKRLVWQTPGAGAINRLRCIEQPTAELNAGQLRIRVRAVGLNFADIFALTGLYSATPEGAFIPGLEYAGEVIAVGNSCSDFQVGDRVMGVTRFGGYASHIDTDPAYLQPLPDDWTFEQGAAYLVQTLTAWYALTTLGAIKAGHRVLIHSGAGGVGLQAMKLARALGARPVATVSSAKKAEFLQSLGFNECLIRQADFKRQLQSESQGFDLVLDAIGGSVQKASFRALRPMGRLVVFGAAEFTPGSNRPHYLKAALQWLRRPRYDVMDMISDNRSVMAFNLIWLWEQLPLMQQLVAEMSAIDITPPHVGHHFDFADAHEALQCLRSGNTIGKVVLTINN